MELTYNRLHVVTSDRDTHCVSVACIAIPILNHCLSPFSALPCFMTVMRDNSKYLYMNIVCFLLFICPRSPIAV